jgi:hypothetical protein
MQLAKMTDMNKKMLLVGDNPFHGISHLSQERARSREDPITDEEYAAKLVVTAARNGANGFMFSVSEQTLSIIRRIHEMGEIGQLRLYALVPYAYEYVRAATQLGGISGLAKKIGKQVLVSGNLGAIAMGLKGIIKADLAELMKMYLSYELSRIKSSAGRNAGLDCVLLHEIITDMGLGLNLDWLFKIYVDFMLKLEIKPGFETRNFVYLTKKFREWIMDFEDIVIAAPFNKVGFQMNPSKTECEKALASLPGPNLIAMSILAAGYLKPPEAVNYIQSLPNLGGTVVGVSKEVHACETFNLLRERFEK